MLGKRIFLYLFLYLILNISYAQRMPTPGEVWSNAERRVYENEILRQQAIREEMENERLRRQYQEEENRRQELQRVNYQIQQLMINIH